MYSKTIEQILYTELYEVQHLRNGLLKRVAHNLTHKYKIPAHYAIINQIKDKKDPAWKYAHDTVLDFDNKKAVYIHNHNFNHLANKIAKRKMPFNKLVEKDLESNKNRVGILLSGTPQYEQQPSWIKKAKPGMIHVFD